MHHIWYLVIGAGVIGIAVCIWATWYHQKVMDENAKATRESYDNFYQILQNDLERNDDTNP